MKKALSSMSERVHQGVIMIRRETTVINHSNAGLGKVTKPIGQFYMLSEMQVGSFGLLRIGEDVSRTQAIWRQQDVCDTILVSQTDCMKTVARAIKN